MQVKISENSYQGFGDACDKLGITQDLPDVSRLREDFGLWIIANYMLAVIIESGKNGDIRDITDHTKSKYEVWHTADHGYVPGSGSGFSYLDFVNAYALARVGARLTFNSRKEGKENTNEYPDLWEIVMLNVK